MSPQFRKMGIALFACVFVVIHLTGCSGDGADDLTDVGPYDVSDAPPQPTCDDGIKNGDETDVDCGGPDCEPCEVGLRCDVDSDCQSDICHDGVCISPECEGVECNHDEQCYRGRCYRDCSDDTDCDEDSRCFEGHCAPLDCEGVDCRENEVCYQGGCYPACSTDADCGEDEACIDNACVDPCELQDCGPYQTCYRGVCYDTCDEQADCDAENRCYEDHCAPLDCEGVDCLETETCYQGVCYETCSDDAHCENEAACIESSCVDPCELVECEGHKTCHRGVCYDTCDEQADCDGDNRCHEDSCVPVDCEGVDCLEYEVCYYGACYPFCDDEADCEDGSVCDNDACVERCYEDTETGDWICPTLAFHTLDAEDITATSAVLRGRFNELPLDLPPDHGFCFSTESEPEFSAANCHSLGPATTEGIFEHTADGLDPGRQYFVQAYVEYDGEIQLTNQRDFITAAPTVVNLEASQGTSTEHVELTWEAAEGVTEYVIFRDETEIDTVDASKTDYKDDEAQPSEGIGAPTDVTASDAEYTDLVRISWEASEVTRAGQHDYTMTAVYPDATSVHSEEAEGFRASPEITSYEIEIDDSEEWIDVGMELSYDDESAPPPVIDPGQALASKGEFVDHVALELTDAEGFVGTSASYRVRATGDDEPGEASEPVEGRRDIGELSIQWERAEEDVDTSFEDIEGATTTTYDDPEAPDDGSIRYYRATVDADGAAPQTTDSAFGFRAALPNVDTLPATDVTGESATLHGEITDLGAPDPSAHGFCISTDPDPALENADCDDLGPADSTESFSASAADLDSGVVYYVRAFATTNAGTDYGDNETFTTVTNAPTGLEASKGTEVDRVVLTWEGVSTALTYRVFRDGTEIGTVDDTTYEDFAADEGKAPDAVSVSATSGDHTDRVVVNWTEASADNGTAHSYYIVAVNESGDSAPSDTDTGYRGAYPITNYEMQIDSEGWFDVGDTTSFDDTGANPPTVDAGAVSASDGTFAEYVLLESTGTTATPGDEHTYEVRAVNDTGNGDANADQGHIGVGPLEIQWQRSAGDADADYSDIVDATTATYEDVDAPEDGSGRYYRTVVSADGADDQISNAERGFRAALPDVDTLPTTDITETSATLHGDIVDLGAPDPSAHGFCISTDPDPALGSADCDDLGATDSTGPFSAPATELEPGTVYYVRAFATTNAGTDYGNNESFITVADAPTGLTASDGTSPDHVFVSWNGVDGADEYDLFRGGDFVTTVTSTSYDDTGADEGTAPDAVSVSATSGDHTDRVAVTWTEASADDGTTHSYHVVAVNESGDSTSSNTDTGYRSAYPIFTYEMQIDSEGWFDVGDTTSFDDTGADPPTVDAGAVSASDGTFAEYVLLESTGTTATPGDEHTYEVRAVNDTGNGDADADQGHIGVGPLEIQWQRSADDADADYSDIVDATTATYEDVDAPEDGSGRYYRTVVSADGADDQISDAERGFRAALPDVATLPTTDITETSATLHGDIIDLGAPDPSAHGFCISTDPDPALETADCDDLGPTGATGSFSATTTELEPGTVYYVRAFATTNAGTDYGDNESFTTIADAPTGLTASDGTSPDHVTVSWNGVDGADEYDLFRDSNFVTSVTSTSYDDTGADEGTAPDAVSVSATSGDHTDRVAVTWTEASADDGTTHSYHVVAVNESGDSEPSNTDTGYRSAYPIFTYEMQIDSGGWFDVGDTTSFDDTGADPPTVDAGAVSASDGTFAEYVLLESTGTDTTPGDEHTYEVRAVNDTGNGNANADQGHIGVGPLEIQWQRSADDADADYSDIVDATTATYEDVDAPEDGSGRYYRTVVSADGADDQISDAERGFRAALPDVATLPTTDITETSATLHGDIIDLGAPDPSAHGFCISTDPDPALETADCDDLGPTGATGSFSATTTELEPGTVYYVRAFATTNAGTDYGDNESFTTIAAAPTGLTASDGTSPDHVTVSWNGVDGADGYDLFRDSNFVTTVTSTSYDDTGADEGTAPDAVSVSATSGDHTDRVAVTWTEASADDGTTHSYHVVAVNESGDSEPSNTDTGYRSAYPIFTYEMQIDGGGWFDVGDTTSFDDTGADPPTVDAGQASATEGAFTSYVLLKSTDTNTTPGDEHTYEVRAVNDTGNGNANADQGHIGVGPLEIQWQRSADDVDTDFTDIEGATTAEYEDEAPPVGEGRYYRVVASAEGAETQMTASVYGFRAIARDVRVGSRDGRVREIDGDSEQNWVYDVHDDAVLGTAVDSAGYIYTASWDATVRKHNPEGEELWTFVQPEGYPLYEVAVDGEGNVYASGGIIGQGAGNRDGIVHKLNSEGDEQWSAGGFLEPNVALTVDNEGNVYTGSWDTEVRKMNAEDGATLWSNLDHDAGVYGVAVNADGDVLTAGGDGTFRKLDGEEGTELWVNDDHGEDTVFDIAVDADGYIYTSAEDGTIRKHDTEGNHLWTFQSCCNWVYAVAIDPEGGIYGASYDGGEDGGDNEVVKVGPDSALMWRFDMSSDPMSVAVDPGTYSAFPAEW